MNKLKYLLSAFVLLCFASCKDDPWEDVADGGWNHERSIIDVKFEGQAGTPTITETDSETGVIELQLASDMVADMSKVRVETLTLSYKATANVASGGTIDFTKGDPQIVVTSPNGESRTYTLEMTEFTETLTGTYTISNLSGSTEARAPLTTVRSSTNPPTSRGAGTAKAGDPPPRWTTIWCSRSERSSPTAIRPEPA